MNQEKEYILSETIIHSEWTRKRICSCSDFTETSAAIRTMYGSCIKGKQDAEVYRRTEYKSEEMILLCNATYF